MKVIKHILFTAVGNAKSKTIFESKYTTNTRSKALPQSKTGINYKKN